ncbi:MAG: fused MFS/spermidine synthase [Kiritimatiellaeota bacterium]|nr:fused MFS/spermidine synthase [Kiritimatiellota bacterium]
MNIGCSDKSSPIAAVFCGSFLLFLIQPLVGRTLLPVFGGSASVWMICLACYQTLLLAGYFYAHWFQRARRLHVALLGLAAVWTGALVFARPFIARLGDGGSPTLGVLFCVLLVAGLPYTLLAAGSTLVQAWVAGEIRNEELGIRNRGADVYSLYAVSNAGSLLGLLAYPLVLEPFVPLTAQWLGFAAAVAAYAALMRRMARERSSKVLKFESSEILKGENPQSEILNLKSKISPLWFLLPAVSAFLLNAVTMALMVEVTPMPFVWVLTLAAFLLSYVLGFSKASGRWRWLWSVLALLALAGAAWARGKWGTGSFIPNAAAGVAVLALVGTVLHRWLYERRPPVASLTRYYLAIAAGGAAGGLLASLVSPLVFDRVLEYPLILCVCAALMAWRISNREEVIGNKYNASGTHHLSPITYYLLPLAAGLGFFALLGATARKSDAKVLYRCRNFYGCLAVSQKYEGLETGRRLSVHYLWCGQTTHGLQVRDASYARVPTAYYGATGGGIAFAAHPRYREGQPMSVGVVGLGAGMLALYGREGDLYRFFEINPQVVQIATAPQLFSFLPDARCAIDLIDGDARRMLETERATGDPLYDMLVIDAYSGDAVPYHLVTREAFRLYLDRLAPGGMLAVHISNWHIDLLPVCKAVAADLGVYMVGTIGYADTPVTSGSIWVFMTRHPVTYPHSEKVRRVNWDDVRDIRPLTDDRGSLLPLLR